MIFGTSDSYPGGSVCSLSSQTWYLDTYFRNFSHFREANAGIIYRISSRPLPFTSFPICSWDAIQSKPVPNVCIMTPWGVYIRRLQTCCSCCTRTHAASTVYLSNILLFFKCLWWRATVRLFTTVTDHNTFLNHVQFTLKRLATGWTVRGSNAGGGDIFRTRPDFPWVPPSLLYNGYRVTPGATAVGEWRWSLTPSRTEFKEGIELYLCSPVWAFVACSRMTFTFTFYSQRIEPKSVILNILGSAKFFCTY